MLIFRYLFITALLLVGFILYSSVDEVPLVAYNSCSKVWMHKGTYPDEVPNSLKSIKKALEAGVNGVELDIYFDTSLSDFVISHDFPYKRHNNELLYLYDVFYMARNNTNIKFWLDFKNLKKLNYKSTIKSASILNKFLISFDLKRRTLIESTGVKNLSIYSESSFITSYWVDLSIKNIPALLRQVYYYYSHNFDFLSMRYQDYGILTKILFPIAKINLFTVNSASDIYRFIKDNSVKIILTDVFQKKNVKCKI